jgi:NADP-dependent 3-hydroxy acid dehydrogenase YdfG
MLDANVCGTFVLTAALVPGMVARERVDIVDIGTMAASMGVAEASVHSATKAALESSPAPGPRSAVPSSARGRRGRGPDT